MLRLHARHGVWKIAEKVFHFILSEFVIFGIPLLCVSQAFAINFIALCLIAELIIKELVKKHFRYNLIFAACASQSVSPGSALQRVDKGDGSLRYIDVAHYCF